MQTKIVTLTITLASSVALAQPSGDAPVAPTPSPPATPAPTAPATPTPTDPNAPATPAPDATATTTTTAPAVTAQPADVPKSPPVTTTTTTEPMTDTGEPAPKKKIGNPKIALEVSGTAGYAANQYVEYRGWVMENGANKGGRFELNLIGIQIAYELSSMSNKQACANDGCVMGDYGSTTMHAFELGYRFRFGMAGPVRPFAALSLGGVLASAGDWSATSQDKLAKGGVARGGFGIEYPVNDKFFISATLAYRLLVTENPLRNIDSERANKLFVGGTSDDIPTGDYVEDLHMVSGYLGVGMAL